MGLFELIYYAGYSISKRLALKRRKSLPVRVISIGNITTGGTGKTPMVIRTAIEAKRRGLRPCILTRGYRGRLKGPVVVDPSEGGHTELDVGDEPLMTALRLTDVPVVKGADRHASGLFALETLDPRPDLFILDDGFQHRALARDLDVLLINALEPFGGRKLLPVGLLREPPGEIRRADAVVITNSDGAASPGGLDELKEEIRKYNPGAPVFTARYRVTGAVEHASGREFPAMRLRGKKVYAFSGTGSPGSFLNTLKAEGADLRGSSAFADHYRYDAKEINAIQKDATRAGAAWIITTEKDIIRLRGLEGLPRNLLALWVELDVQDESLFDMLFREVS